MEKEREQLKLDTAKEQQNLEASIQSKFAAILVVKDKKIDELNGELMTVQ